MNHMQYPISGIIEFHFLILAGAFLTILPEVADFNTYPGESTNNAPMNY
jgi:hypothetical protein